LASGGTAPYVYELNGNQNSTGVFNSLPSGDYVILVTDANNCMTDIFANIGQQTAGGETLDLGPDQLLCQGDSVTLSATGNFLTYQWFWDNQLLEANGPNLVVATEGSYRLEAQTQDGCRLSDELIVSFSRLEGSASGDTEIERGDSTQLNASNGQNYQWTPSEGLSCTDCRSPKAAPENTTTYLVDFATIDGCPASDSVVVRVTVPEDELRFEPVTFLSPNGDGQNDELYFPGLESYKSNDLNIYSRWGQLIFSKIDYQISGALWDGTLRGQPLPAGVYYYILRVDEQNITVKRNLTIVY
jgi:gliding motility-associated-like protein